MDIDNDELLEQELIKEIGLVMKKTAKNIHYEVTKNIEEIVYDPYEPQVYKRLKDAEGGYLDSWTYKEQKESRSRSISYIVESEASRMISESPHHASPDGEDRREVMTESIIRGINWDYSYKSKKAGQKAWWKYPRNFWTPTISIITDDYFKQTVQREIYRNTGWYLGIGTE